MQVFSKMADFQAWRVQQKGSLAFVPTMGALHAGHAFLLETARRANDLLVVSIFVNPLQFGPTEDLAKYPKTFEADLALCERLGVDAVFAPEASEIYLKDLNEITTVNPRPKPANCLCGLSRPGHFSGVLTVVLKLFNLVQPHRAYFGEKDYQQYYLIRAMVEDFNLPVEVLPLSTQRSDSGLALSSRNKYLSEPELLQASVLYATLKQAEAKIKAGEKVQGVLAALHKTNFEYFESRNPETLEKTETLPLRLFVAAKVGPARLIDNLLVS